MNNIMPQNTVTFIMLEKEIFRIFCGLACEELSRILEAFDKGIKQNRDKKTFRDKGLRQTTVKTPMGEVTFERTVYEYIDDEGNKCFKYLLDEMLKIDTIGKMSMLLAQKVVENASLVSYRNAAKNVTELTGQSISHGGAWNIVQALGTKVKEDEERLAAAAEKGELCGEREVPILFEEADGVCINMQGKDRKESGHKQEMKIAVTYEGWKKVGKDRFELINKNLCAGFDEAKTFYKKKEGMVASLYNTDEIIMRIRNGDGAKWIKSEMDDTYHYQLDPFHKNKAVFRHIRNEEQRNTIFEFLKSNKIIDLLEYLDALSNSIEDEKEAGKVRDLYKYFKDNEQGMTPWQTRGLDVPPPPDGMVYRNLGTMEHHVCDVIAQRMKHRKASWSRSGADNLAKLLAAKASKRLHEVVEKFSIIVLPEEQTREIIETLSAAKTPKKDGKGSDGTIPKGRVPFADAAVTNGRKAIRDMFAIRGFGELTYR